MKKKLCVSFIAAAFAASNSYAAFQINSFNSAHEITFEVSIGYDGASDSNTANNVIKVGPTGAYRLMESGTANWKNSDVSVLGNVGFSSDAWAWRHPNIDYSGHGGSKRTFWGDYNNDGDLEDQSGLSNIFFVGEYFGDTGNRGLVIGNPGAGSADSTNSDISLRIQNNTGEAVSLWNIGIDFWIRDDDAASSNLVVSYSINDTDYVTLETLTGVGTGGAWSSVEGGDYDSVSAMVDNGDYIYLRFLNDRQSGSNGSAWGIDNISVTAVPEPSTYAMISGIVLFAFAAIRRRRK